MASTVSGVKSLFAGNTLGSIFIGIIIFQSMSYWRHNTDGWKLRTMVSVMLLSTIVIMFSVTYSFFDIFVVRPADPDSLSLLFHAPTMVLSISLTAVVVFLSHLFFIRTLLFVRRSRWWVWGSVSVLAFFCLVLRLASAGILAANKSFVTGKIPWVGLAITINCSAALADLIVTITIVTFIRVPCAPSQQKLFQRVCVYSILRGSCVVLVQLIQALLFAIPHNFYWMALDINIAHIYCITTFAMLNSRVYLRGIQNGPIVDSAVHVTHSTSPSLRFAQNPDSPAMENRPDPQEQNIQLDFSNICLAQGDSDIRTAQIRQSSQPNTNEGGEPSDVQNPSQSPSPA